MKTVSVGKKTKHDKPNQKANTPESGVGFEGGVGHDVKRLVFFSCDFRNSVLKWLENNLPKVNRQKEK